MPNDEGERRAFDLEERTALFGEAVIAFAKRVPVNLVTTPLIPQVVRSATSVGANYVEADDADSKKDFRYRIGVARRESKETKHWLRMIVAAEPQLRDDARPLWKEAKELNLIFGAIRRKGEDRRA
jgi:four helix bundle protein